MRSKDGIRLHAEVFGPEDGYPIVLAHGITCAIRVWAYQIADLAKDHRVIAFDHRGHGRSARARRGAAATASNFLAADLDAVLDATLQPGERAVIAGHSMGGIAITSWSERYPERVRAARRRRRADQHHDRRPAAPRASSFRCRHARRRQGARGRHAAEDVRRDTSGAGGRPAEPAVRPTIAVGRDADPAIADFVYELFTETPPAGRGGWARALVDSLGTNQHIGLQNLTVPTLVIGSEKDRLLPMVSSRHIARMAPNLAEFVELSGGHCAILERPTR